MPRIMDVVSQLRDTQRQLEAQDPFTEVKTLGEFRVVDADSSEVLAVVDGDDGPIPADTSVESQ